MADQQITIQVEENKIINVTDVLGTLRKADAAPTVKGLYFLEEVGNYTNLGLVAQDMRLNYATFDGTNWRLSYKNLPSPNVTNINNSYNVDPEQIVPSEALYNDETLAGDIMKRVDKSTGENSNYREIQSYIDGTPINDSKVDGVIFIKKNGKYYKRQFEFNINVKWFGAKGDGNSDDTLAFKKAFSYLKQSTSLNLIIPSGIYLISETLVIENEFNIIGQNSFKQIKEGGAGKENTSIIRWIGSESSVIMKINNVSGIEISRICFDTGNGQNFGVNGITGLQFVNKSVTRHNVVKHCYFNLLSKGIEFFDDGSNSYSNSNMDSNSIQNCIFYYCEIGICIDQLNVYNCDIYYCSFYGNYSYTKNHILIKKGHADIIGGYFGVLKDENSVGGKNGVAIDVSQGFFNISNVYGECHNGDFLVWRSSNINEASISSINNCIINADSSKFPNDWQVLNETNNLLNINGGHFTGKFCQKSNSNGYILVDNSYNPQISESSKSNAVILKGVVNGYESQGNEIRSMSKNPKVSMFNLNTQKEIQMIWGNDDILTFTVPGHYGGIQFDFPNKTIFMGGWTFVQ